MTHLTPQEFGDAFAFDRSAFRLELLDRYADPSEADAFRRFLAGEPQDPAWCQPWAQFVRDALRDGKRMARVHVVDEPLNDYLVFELTCGYPASAAAGEDVRILRRGSGPDLPLPDHDFWLFDDRQAAVMIYDDHGNFLGADTSSDPDLLALYCQARGRAMQSSVPLADFLALLGMKDAP